MAAAAQTPTKAKPADQAEATPSRVAATAQPPTKAEPADKAEPTPATAQPSKDAEPADKAEATPSPTDAPAQPPTDAEQADKARTTQSGKPDGPSKGEAEPTDKDQTGKKPTEGQIDLDKPVVVTTTTSTGRRVTRVLRHANPIKAARTATRTTHAWAKRPTGRLLVPAIAAALLIAIAGAAGAYLVPKALKSGSVPSARPGFPLDQAAGGPSVPPPGPVNGAAGPSGVAVVPPSFAAGNENGARPADALNGWAQGVGTRVGIPVVAVQAYGYAELVAARTAPGCHLTWTTIAAIAKVESAHGSANGAVLGTDGSVQPPIYGLPLDGKGGRQLIRDTDQGTIDGDSQFDRAVGPLQFIPATWKQMQVDADNSGSADPNDIDDAALAAGLYLCQGGRDLARGEAWWDAILSYNALRPYAQKVFDAAQDYGQRSRV